MNRSRWLALALVCGVVLTVFVLAPVASATEPTCPPSVSAGNRTYCIVDPAQLTPGPSVSGVIKVGNASLGTTLTIGSGLFPGDPNVTFVGSSLPACKQKNPTSPCDGTAAYPASAVITNGFKIAPGQSSSFTVFLKIPAATTVINWPDPSISASSSYNCANNPNCNLFTKDPNASDNRQVTTITQQATLTVTQTPQNSPPQGTIGELYKVALQVTSSPGGPATGALQLTKTATGGSIQRWESESAGEWSCSGTPATTVTCDRSEIGAGGGTTGKLLVYETRSDAGTVTNHACAKGAQTQEACAADLTVDYANRSSAGGWVFTDVDTTLQTSAPPPTSGTPRIGEMKYPKLVGQPTQSFFHTITLIDPTQRIVPQGCGGGLLSSLASLEFGVVENLYNQNTKAVSIFLWMDGVPASGTATPVCLDQTAEGGQAQLLPPCDFVDQVLPKCATVTIQNGDLRSQVNQFAGDGALDFLRR